MGTERQHTGQNAPPALRRAPARVARARPRETVGVVVRVQRYAGNAVAPAVWRCGTHPCGPGGCGEADRGLQLSPEVTVSHPADPAEVEADRVAEEVMRAAEVPGAVPEDEEMRPEEDEALARSAEQPAPASDPAPGTARAIADARGRGVPLDRDVRGFMEERFGRDLGAVRVHTDPAAGALAHQVHARAFTTGTDVFFGLGQYRPDEPGGRRLLAHELAHVVQQSGVPHHPDPAGA